MLIRKIGEFGLIERFARRIKTDSSVIKGSGDDCAVLKFSKDKYLLATCDMLIEGVDFTPAEDPYLIGRKSVAVSLSDIAACAGIARYALISLGLPGGASVGSVDRIFRGMLDLAGRYKINIIGGDLSRADKITIDVSMLGFVEKKFLAVRGGAKNGDIIFVSGSLGGSIKGKHLRFTPRLKEARFLARNFRINSMIDISDGLAQDLGHILKASRKGAVIYEKAIPLSAQAKGLSDALYSGEDFELLFTLSQKDSRRLLKSGPKIFKPIGEITKERNGLSLIDKNNRQKKILPLGYRHF